MMLTTLVGLQQMTKLLELITNKKLELAKLAHGHGVSTTGSSFAYFEKLPAELKHMVLEAAVPSPRVVTRRSEDILNDVLGANSLTRAIIKSRYSRIANPLCKQLWVFVHILPNPPRFYVTYSVSLHTLFK